jgi:type II secretory pathway component PulF
VLQHYGIFLAVLAVAVVLGLLHAINERRAAWHALLLDLPLVGPLRHSLATARVARTLGALLGTGTPALAALATAREAVGDAAVAERLDAARARVAQGTGLTTALETSRVITSSAIQLSAIGEESGKLPGLLAKAADLEEQDAERRLKTLVSFLEPLLIVAFGGVIAFVAAALLQAVYALRP